MSDNSSTYIYLIILLLIVARSLYTFATFSSTFWWLKRQRDNNVKNTDKHFVVVPVLREQRVLRETIEWFLNMDYPRDKLTVVIVTTEREFTTTTDGQTT